MRKKRRAKQQGRVNKICKQCLESFSAVYSKRDKLFCSKECYYKHRRGNSDYKSYWLGKTFSKEHKKKLAIARTGNKNPMWNGGRSIDKDGYILIMKKDHPSANPNGYVREHRLVVEDNIGRYLERGEVVHHENGIKDDNRIENLKLYASHSLHISEDLNKHKDFICKCGRTDHAALKLCEKCYQHKRYKEGKNRYEKI